MMTMMKRIRRFGLVSLGIVLASSTIAYGSTSWNSQDWDDDLVDNELDASRFDPLRSSKELRDGSRNLGRALVLSQIKGSGIKLPFGERFSAANPFTLEFWYSPVENGTDKIEGDFFSFTDGNMNYSVKAKDSKLLLQVADKAPLADADELELTTDAKDAKWVHVAISWKLEGGKGTMTFYKNGIAIGAVSDVLPPAKVQATNDAVLGRGFAQGYLDEFRVWNVAKEAADIKAEMNTQAWYKDNAQLVAYYRFDDGGESIEDLAHMPDFAKAEELYQQATDMGNGLTEAERTNLKKDITKLFGYRLVAEDSHVAMADLYVNSNNPDAIVLEPKAAETKVFAEGHALWFTGQAGAAPELLSFIKDGKDTDGDGVIDDGNIELDDSTVIAIVRKNNSDKLNTVMAAGDYKVYDHNGNGLWILNQIPGKAPASLHAVGGGAKADMKKTLAGMSDLSSNPEFTFTDGKDSDSDGIEDDTAIAKYLKDAKDPSLVDSDDDGIADADEQKGAVPGDDKIKAENDPTSPLFNRALDLTDASEAYAEVSAFTGNNMATSMDAANVKKDGFTLELWYKVSPYNTSKGGLLLSKTSDDPAVSGDFTFGLNDDGKLYVEYRTIGKIVKRATFGVRSFNAAELGWIHAAVSVSSTKYNSDAMNVNFTVFAQGVQYVSGDMQMLGEINLSSGKLDKQAQAGNLLIGSKGMEHLRMTVDEVRIWKGLRNVEELANDRHFFLTKESKGWDQLTAYFRFDDGGISACDFKSGYGATDPKAAQMFGAAKFHENQIASEKEGDETYAYLNKDFDGDKIPDFWELANFKSLKVAGYGNVDHYTDTDGDGVNDYYEFRAELDPLEKDINFDVDTDGDGLTLLEEQAFMSNPNKADSDDDGMNDYDETANWGTAQHKTVTNPNFSVAHYNAELMTTTPNQSLDLSKVSGVEVSGDRFVSLNGSYAVEAWFKASGAVTGNLVTLKQDSDIILALAMDGLKVKAMAGAASVTTVEDIVNDTWTHVAAVYNVAEKTLSVVVNGVSKDITVPTAKVYKYDKQTTLVLGGASKGLLDEVRVFNAARSLESITKQMKLASDQHTIALVAYYRFDDGGKTLEDSMHPYPAELDDDPEAYSLKDADPSKSASDWLTISKKDGKYDPAPVLNDPEGTIPNWWAMMYKTPADLGIQQYRGHFYELVNSKKTWTESTVAAELAKGTLPIISSQGENNFLSQNLMADNKGAWIGLTDDKKEGEFVWVDGTKLADSGYSNWSSKTVGGTTEEPNNGYYDGKQNKDENYAFLVGAAKSNPKLAVGYWNDAEEKEAFGDQDCFIIEHRNYMNLKNKANEVLAEADWDGDGIKNYQEYLAGINPTEKVTDGTVDDNLLPNIDNHDTDKDGLSDKFENQIGTDPNKADTDGDGIDDVFEVRRFNSDPLSPYSPLRNAVLDLSEGGHAIIKDFKEIGKEDNFTFEVWFKLLEGSGKTGTILSKTTATGRGDFTLSLENGVPTFTFWSEGKEDKTDTLTPEIVKATWEGMEIKEADGWVNISVSVKRKVDNDPGRYQIEFNGWLLNRVQSTFVKQFFGVVHHEEVKGDFMVGQETGGLKMLVDEVRVWNKYRSLADLSQTRHIADLEGLSVVRDQFPDQGIPVVNAHLALHVRFDDACGFTADMKEQKFQCQSFGRKSKILGERDAAKAEYEKAKRDYENYDEIIGGKENPSEEEKAELASLNGVMLTKQAAYAKAEVAAKEIESLGLNMVAKGNAKAKALDEVDGITASGDTVTFDAATGNGLYTLGYRAIRGAETYTYLFADLDEDNLPDWWENAFFGGLDASDGKEDGDDDGLNDYYEYLTGNDPKNLRTDDTMNLDGDKDSDGDGVVDKEELRHGTDPSKADTDDDGFTDYEEIMALSAPTHPAAIVKDGKYAFTTPKSLDLSVKPFKDGMAADAAYSELSFADRFIGNESTIELWFKHSAPEGVTATIFEAMSNNGYGYRLKLENGSPRGEIFKVISGIETVVAYVGGAKATPALEANTWTHLALAWTWDRRSYVLYRDMQAIFGSDQLPEKVTFGQRAKYARLYKVEGAFADEIRVWRKVRRDSQIESYAERIIPMPQSPYINIKHMTDYDKKSETMSLEAYYRFDDGGEKVEDFAHFGDEAYMMTLTDKSKIVEGVENGAKALQGIDDVDGDGIPEWWVELNGLNAYIKDSAPHRWVPGNTEKTYCGRSGFVADIGYLPIGAPGDTLVDQEGGEWVCDNQAFNNCIAAVRLHKYINVSSKPAKALLSFVKVGGVQVTHVYVNQQSVPNVAGADSVDIAEQLQTGRNQIIVFYMRNMTRNEDVKIGDFTYKTREFAGTLDVQLTMDGRIEIAYGHGNAYDPRSVWFYYAVDDHWAGLCEHAGIRLSEDENKFQMGIASAPQVGPEDRNYGMLLDGDDFKTSGGFPADKVGDGLSVYDEFLLGTNPRYKDSNNNGIEDGDEDNDGDGIANKREVIIGTDPTKTDTDNDGIADNVERGENTDPMDFNDPVEPRMLVLDGDPESYLVLPLQNRFRMDTAFTLEAWINPEATADKQEIITRTVGTNDPDKPLVNYSMYVEGGKLKATFTDKDGKALNETASVEELKANEWTHVAVTYDGASVQLYVNGENVKSTAANVLPVAAGPGIVSTIAGKNFKGKMDDLRIWNVARTANDIANHTKTTLSGSEQGLVAYYRFEDVNKEGREACHSEFVDICADSAKASAQDWKKNWINAAALHGNAKVEAYAEEKNPLESDVDSNNNRIPDVWEYKYFAKLLTDDDKEDGKYGDKDGDGLINYYEYLSGTNPLIKYTKDDKLDTVVDADGDTLTNLQEQQLGLYPNQEDSDDDTYLDNKELNAMDPYRSQVPGHGSVSVMVNKDGKVTYRGWTMAMKDEKSVIEDRYFFKGSLTIETWMKFMTIAERKGLISKAATVKGSDYYSLDMDADGYLTFSMGANKVKSQIKLAADMWYHIAAILNVEEGSMILNVSFKEGNGKMKESKSEVVFSGNIPESLGTDVIVANTATDEFYMDDLRVFEGARSLYQVIADREKDWTIDRDGAAPGNLKIYSTFNDKGVTAENFAADRISLINNPEITVFDDLAAGQLTNAEFVLGGHDKPLEPGDIVDIDSDGIDDKWEIENFGNLTTAGEGDVDGYTDNDGDGLNDFYESLLGDKQDAKPEEDKDGDGLTNLQEQKWATHPDKKDTDDDGVNDGVEVFGRLMTDADNPTLVTHPAYSMAHYSKVLFEENMDPAGTQPKLTPARYLYLKALNKAAGEGNFEGIELPDRDEFMELGEAVTLETWVKVPRWTADLADKKQILMAVRAGDKSILELGYDVNADGKCFLYASYDTVSDPVVLGGKAMDSTNVIKQKNDDASEWFHVAATYSAAEKTMKLFVNGVVELTKSVEYEPSIDSSERIKVYLAGNGNKGVDNGAMKKGALDETRVWNKALTVEQLRANRDRIIDGKTEGLIAYYRYDDGGMNIEDFCHPYPNFQDAMKYELKADDYSIAEVDEDGTAVWMRTGTVASDEKAKAFMGMDDGNADGLPDWWCAYYAKDHRDAFAFEASEDDDTDGLTNLFEFYCRTSPLVKDTDSNGVNDDNEDFDGDGLCNKDEQRYGCDPRLEDSDDDGKYDKDEVDAGTSPTHPTSRTDFAKASLDLAKAHDIALPDATRFMMEDKAWTVETWFKLGTKDKDGDIFDYRSNNGNSFRLSVKEGYPVGAIYNGDGDKITDLVAVGGKNESDEQVNIPQLIEGEWTHLALVWSPEEHSLKLYLNGISHVAKKTMAQPFIGAGVATLGKNFTDGYIDEFRVWGEKRSQAELERWMHECVPTHGTIDTKFVNAARLNSQLAGSRNKCAQMPTFDMKNIYEYSDLLKVYYRFDDCGKFAEDYTMINAGSIEARKAYFLNIGTEAFAKTDAANVRSIDDEDGDGIPEYWVALHGLDNWRKMSRFASSNNFSGATNTGDWMQVIADNRASVPADGSLANYKGMEATGWNLGAGMFQVLDKAAAATDGPNPRPNIGYIMRDFTVYGSIGNMTQGVEDYEAVSTKSSVTYPSGMYVQLWKYVVLDRKPEKAPFTINLVNGTISIMQINGVTVAATANQPFDVAQYLRKGRNQIYIYLADNGGRTQSFSVTPPGFYTLKGKDEKTPTTYHAWPMKSVSVPMASMKADFQMEADGKQIIVRGDDYKFDPRAVWHGRTATSSADLGQPDMADKSIGHPGYGLDNDPDKDGLTNMVEYKINTNPLDDDTDNNGRLDGDEDFDGDGLSNADEDRYGTDPTVQDTDDDGMPDGDEVGQGFDPMSGNSYDPADGNSPLIMRALSFKGTEGAYVEFPAQGRFGMKDWTIEVMIQPAMTQPANTGKPQSIIRRQVGTYGNTENKALVTYGLRINEEGKLAAYYTDGTGEEIETVSPEPVKMDGKTWTNVAASYETATRRLFLYIDGAEVSNTTGRVAPIVSGPGLTTVRAGEGYKGLLDEVRFWNTVKSAKELTDGSKNVLSGYEEHLVGYYRFDDKGETAQDSLASSFGDWNTGWLNAARLVLVNDDDIVPEDVADSPVISDEVDTNNNLIPDWWEIKYFGELLKNEVLPDGTVNNEALQDGIMRNDQYLGDSDDLNILYEYLSGTSPLVNMSNGTQSDAECDKDEDGISNLDEQYIGSRPDKTDTDDDSFSDDVEEGFGGGDYLSSAVSSLEQPNSTKTGAASLSDMAKVFRMDEATSMTVKDNKAHTGNVGTIAFWFKPRVDGADSGDLTKPDGDVVFLRRTVKAQKGHENYKFSFNWKEDTITFRVGRKSTSTSASFFKAVYKPAGGFERNQWYYIAGTYDLDSKNAKHVTLIGFAPKKGAADKVTWNGTQNINKEIKSNTGSNVGEEGLMTLGKAEGDADWPKAKVADAEADLLLDVDNLCFWNEEKSMAVFRAIIEKNTLGSEFTAGLTSQFLFDDGGVTAEDFTVKEGWWNNWKQAGVIAGATENVTGMIHDASLADFDYDKDRDGLPDAWEIHFFGTLAYGPNDDPDGDGLTNIDEYNLSAGYRNPELGANPGFDEPLAWLDPANNDTDEDGMADGYEHKHSSILNPLDPTDGEDDPDEDGLANWEEALHGTDPTKFDTDEDGMPDGWEITYTHKDSEGKVIDPSLDPLSAEGAYGANGDPDQDGIKNMDEYLYGTNPLVADSKDADTDGDGLKDVIERQPGINTDSALTDTDDDEFDDYTEQNAGTRGYDSLSNSGQSSSKDSFIYKGNLVGQIKAKHGVLTVPAAGNEDRLGFGSWTVEARFRLHDMSPEWSTETYDVYLVRRSFTNTLVTDDDKAVTDAEGWNYAIGYTVNASEPGKVFPFVSFKAKTSTGNTRLSFKTGIEVSDIGDGTLSSEWHFLTGVFNAERHELSMYMDGALITSKVYKMEDAASQCPISAKQVDAKYAYVKIGENFANGKVDDESRLLVDEVRIWGVKPNTIAVYGSVTGYLPSFVRSPAEIADGHRRAVTPVWGVYDASINDRYKTTINDRLVGTNKHGYRLDRHVSDNEWTTKPGTIGYGGRAVYVCYHDANDNGRWDPGEDVWRDRTVAEAEAEDGPKVDPEAQKPEADNAEGGTSTDSNKEDDKDKVEPERYYYDQATDVRLAQGRNRWTAGTAYKRPTIGEDGKVTEVDVTAEQASVGKELEVFFNDKNGNGVIDSEDDIWTEFSIYNVESWYQPAVTSWCERTGLALYLRFDDGGATIEDFVHQSDWRSRPAWKHAIRPVGLTGVFPPAKPTDRGGIELGNQYQFVTEALESDSEFAWVINAFESPKDPVIEIATLSNKDVTGDNKIDALRPAEESDYASDMTHYDVLSAKITKESVDPEGSAITYRYYWLSDQAPADIASYEFVDGELLYNQAELESGWLLSNSKELDLYDVRKQVVPGHKVSLVYVATSQSGMSSTVKLASIDVVASEDGLLRPVAFVNWNNGRIPAIPAQPITLTLKNQASVDGKIFVRWFRNQTLFHEESEPVSAKGQVTFTMGKEFVIYGDVWSYKAYFATKSDDGSISQSRVTPPETTDGNDWIYLPVGVGFDEETEKLSNKPPTTPTRVEISPEHADVNSLLLAHVEGSKDPDGDKFSYQFQWYRNGQPVAGETFPFYPGLMTEKKDENKDDENKDENAEQNADEATRADNDNNDSGNNDSGSSSNSNSGKMAAGDVITVRVWATDLHGNSSNKLVSDSIIILDSLENSNQEITGQNGAYEDNDTFKDATRLLPKKNWYAVSGDTVQTHYFKAANDVDYFWFIVPDKLSKSKTLVKFETNDGRIMFNSAHKAEMDAGVDTKLDLFNADHQMIHSCDNYYIGNASTLYARFEKELDPGLYYVRVYRAGKASAYLPTLSYNVHLGFFDIAGADGPSEATSVVLEPKEPTAKQDLVCYADGAIISDGTDDEPVYHYVWYRNGIVVPFGKMPEPSAWNTAHYTLSYAKNNSEDPAMAAEPHRVPAELTKPGDVWYCVVYAEDSNGFSMGVRSNDVQVSGAYWAMSLGVNKTYRSAAVGAVTGNDQLVTIGLDDNATFGFDPSFDSAAATRYLPGTDQEDMTPLPLGTMYSAGMDNMNTKLNVDYRPYGRSSSWYIKIEMGDKSIDHCTLWWPQPQLPADSVGGLTITRMIQLTDRTWEAMPETTIDMTKETSITLNEEDMDGLQKDSYGQYFIVYRVTLGAADEGQSIDLVKGWNMISFSVTPLNNAVKDVFTDALNKRLVRGNIWRYEGGQYVVATHILAGTGYWVYSHTGGSLKVLGNRPTDGMPLKKGWNLVGPIYEIADVTKEPYNFEKDNALIKQINLSVSDTNGNISYKDIASEGYRMEVGKAYWVLCDEDVVVPVIPTLGE